MFNKQFFGNLGIINALIMFFKLFRSFINYKFLLDLKNVLQSGSRK